MGMSTPFGIRLKALPLGIQLIGIVGCTLLIAQAVTLVLTLLLPPSPPRRWDMAEVAAGLTQPGLDGGLERAVLDGPPDIAGDGWLVSPASRQQLAQRLGRAESEVVLAFYTQLPVGGVAIPANSRAPLARGEPERGDMIGTLLIGAAEAQSIPGGPPPGGPGPGPGMSGAGFPGGGFPGGGLPGGFPQPGAAMPGRGGESGVPASRSGPAAIAPAGSAPAPSRGGPAGVEAPRAPAAIGMGGALVIGPGLPMQLPVTAAVPTLAERLQPRATVAPDSAVPVAASDAPAPPSASVMDQPVAAPVAPRAATAAVPVAGQPTGQARPIPFRQTTPGLLGLGSPPFIDGDFIAAARRPDGRWTVIAPKAEGFPNRWQRRVAIWFALSLALIAPLTWLFARRIVRPLENFARAADILGRDPSATILPLSGPAEIGRTANAFNLMRARLRAFVDDRTAVVGAISHDLRTPLTRLRFRIENVPDDQRDGLLKEVAEMEEMITQVVAYIRDAATPGPREATDLRALLQAVIEDARLIGSEVGLDDGRTVAVVVDPVGLRRLLANLVENAIKYGGSAQVRLRVEEGLAIADIIDQGPGIAEDERERVFEPFYRSDMARRSGKAGSGLGLAVCRSIARAHGGDVCFLESGEGFVTRLSVPVAFGETVRLAA
jgi:signal transduction histidine kinase